MIEVFVEMIDALYFEGYAEELYQNNPEKFHFELEEFLINYGSGLKGS